MHIQFRDSEEKPPLDGEALARDFSDTKEFKARVKRLRAMGYSDAEILRAIASARTVSRPLRGLG
jgi:hypothetical protein